MKLLELYQKYLESLNVKADDEGFLTFHYYGLQHPLMAKAKRLALPNPSILQRIGRNEEIAAFHPMSETINRGESPVIQELKKLIRLRVSSGIVSVLATLVDICADKTKHKKLSPSAHKVLSCMPEADEKTVKAFESIMKQMESDEKKMAMIYLKRQGSLQGQKFARLAVFKFPLYDEFEEETGSVFDVKLRKKDFNGLKALIEYVLPNIEDTGTYAIGSNHMVVPYLDSLTRLYVHIGSQINRLAKLYSSFVPDEVKIDLDWADDGEIEWNKYKNVIVPLEDSIGTPLNGEEPEAVKAPVNIPSQQLPPWQQPVHQPAPVSKPRTVQDILRNVHGATTPQHGNVPGYQGTTGAYGHIPVYSSNAPAYPPQQNLGYQPPPMVGGRVVF